MLEAILSSFGLVAASEMGDKTQLLAFSLASRFRRPWAVMAGILVATLANHALASQLGSWVAARVPERVMAGILALTFIAFGLWTLRPDTLDGADRPSRFGPFLTTTVLFFLVEMGDKTQLATVALAARYQSVVLVTAGTTLGMLASDGLAVFVGETLAHRVSMKWLRRGAAALFFGFGLVSAWGALGAPSLLGRGK
ncbi:MAG TPA: TMEM165/GDT1 family protein [Anaeromyxobacteraceae bacterium]|nr:TMEM165/GDT1 family protein [Anaeromyxobacteraceae bacterium]